MVRIELNYNPFTVETKVVYDGTLQTAEMDLFVRNGKRLQAWIDKFIERLPGKVNDKQIDLVFRGTCVDAEDVRQCVEAANNFDKTLKIKLDTTQAVAVTPDEKLKSLKKLVQVARNKSPFDCFKKNKRFLESIECALAPEFEVNVVATMSSGKSTLVNALIGHNFLPAKTKATTAKIVKIRDCDNREAFRARAKSTKGKWGKWQPATASLVEKWNYDESVRDIELEGNLYSISQGANVRLVLVDTPGPNNSQNEDHKKATIDAVRSESLSMVLYVMNASQSAADDDKALLEIVRDALKAGGRQAHERFIFVVNRMDEVKRNEERPADKLQEQNDYLEQNGIYDACILPLSARLALLIRMQRNGEFAGEYADDLEDELNPLTRRFRKYPEFNMIKLAQSVLGIQKYDEFMQRFDAVDSEESEAELLSGVPALEEMLMRYILKYAIPMKIKDAVDVLATVVREAANEEELAKALEQLRADAGKMGKELDSLREDKIRTEMAKRFKDEIESQEYKRSPETEALEDNLHEKLETFFTDNQATFRGQIPPEDAKEKLDAFRKMASEMIRNFESDISDRCEQEYRSQLDELRSTYEKQVQGVVGKSLSTSSLIKNLVTVNLTIPSAHQMMRTSKIKKNEKVGEKWAPKWYNPLTYFNYEDVYEDKEYVNMKKAFDIMCTQMSGDLKNAFETIDESLRDGFASAKEVVKGNMLDVESILSENLTKLRAASKDMQHNQKCIKKTEVKLEWYKRFNKDLQDILAVK